jgi:peptidoglycan/xylan/chitin deacetylase (PgdA/CDA1 family)
MTRLWGALLCAITAVAGLAVLFPTPSQAAGQTVVTLTFDDGTVDQQAAVDLLAAHGMHATFYVNSTRINQPGYFTTQQLLALQSAGNEIAGHTLTHPDLTTLSSDDQKREICNDRVALSNMGLQITNFAYPFGSYEGVEANVAYCGYNSAREIGDIHSVEGCDGCDLAETIPPADPYVIRTPASVKSAWTLADLQSQVTQAEGSGGGWAILPIHDVCDGCSDLSLSPTILGQFLDWLQARAGSGTVVRTMRDVVGGPVQPLVNGPDVGPPPPPPPGTNTVVSIEFDDGRAEQIGAKSILDAAGMKGTFYINSGEVGTTSTYMNWQQLHDLANAGHEIAGHTTSHVNLTAVSSDEATRQVCDDRSALLANGFDVRNFAYPSGANSAEAEAIVQHCGYNSARDVKGIKSPGQCAGCPYAESIPPADPYRTRTPENVNDAMPLSEIQGYVTQAEQHGGGWVQLVFHRLCAADAGCGQYNITPDNFQALVTWLAQRAPLGTTVKTVGDVIGGPTQPAVAGPPPPVGSLTVANPSLESDANNDQLPDCWLLGASGTNTATWSRTADAHSGSFAENVTISAYTSGDRKLLQTQDLGQCAPPIKSGHSYKISQWYKGTGTIAFTVFTRNPNGGWVFCKQSPAFPASSDWKQATYVWSQPPTSANCGLNIGYTPTAISFGLALSSQGSLTVDDAAISDNDTTAPTVALTAPADGATLSGTAVPLAANASDASGIDHVDFLADGAVIATATTAPYTATWDSTAFPNGPLGVSARAVDTAGNSTVSTVAQTTVANTVLPPPDTTPPETLITCDDGACAGTFSAPVSVALSATDDGSGVSVIRYTTDGSDPTTNGTVYSVPFTVATTTTVNYSALDAAGNVEATKSTVVNVPPADQTPPTSSITCNGGSCAGTFTAPVSVALSATDAGTGVTEIRYTTDGSDPQVSGTAYSAPFTVPATATVKFAAKDGAGNVEATQSTTVTVDGTAPTSTITCNGGACTWSSGNVSVALAATDTGTGVKQIRYTTNGSDPRTSGIVYSAPFTITSTATVRFSATDNAGNVEAPKSQAVQIDKTAPVTAARCNGAACPSASTWFAAPMSVTLTATDSASGVANIKYTTDGADPRTSGAVYAGPITVATTSTVRFSATDNAGNVEAPKSVSVQIDTVAPTVTLTKPTNNQQYTLIGIVSLAATAADTGGAGLARVEFFIDGSRVASDTSSPYTGTAIVGRGTHTVTAVAVDKAGNTKTSAPVTIRVN